MSFDGDIHAVFQAIIDSLQEVSSESFFWGLPCSRFELAISWDTFHGVSRRKTRSTLPMTTLNESIFFPSWS